MDQQAFEQAKAAYQRGDWATAAAGLARCKSAGEISGAVDHLLGNSLMKLGRYRDAASAYASALNDRAYGKVGALSCNQGRALLAAGDAQAAVTALTTATRDPEYPTPYKAYLALGNAQLGCGNVREAGIAFRNAAIDDANPDPAVALERLGSCFMQLGRPVDAVEAYRTALDFATPAASQNAIFADLGSAYVAANRMSEAIDSFSHATADGSYALTPEQQASLSAAQKAVAAMAAKAPSDTDAFLSSAGYGGTGSYDPLDPLGKSGEMMPSPEDTGFFEVTEEDLMQQDREYRKMRRKHNHTGLKIFITLLIIALLAAAAAGYAYYRGYGWPTQQAQIESLFQAITNNEDIGEYLAEGVTQDDKDSIRLIIPSGSTVTIDGVDQDMHSSTAYATATLPSGGEQNYTITLARDGITWKITGVELVYPAVEGDSASFGTGEETEGEATEGEAAEGESTESEEAAG